jgi:hypothetical protein
MGVVGATIPQGTYVSVVGSTTSFTLSAPTTGTINGGDSLEFLLNVELSVPQTLVDTTLLTFASGCKLNTAETGCAVVDGDCVYTPKATPTDPITRSCSDYTNFRAEDLSCAGGMSFKCLTNAGQADNCIPWGSVGDKVRDCESGNDEYLTCSSTTEGFVSVPTASSLRCYLAPCTGASSTVAGGVAADCALAGGTVGATLSTSGWSYRTAARDSATGGKVLCSDPSEGQTAQRECPQTCGTCATALSAVSNVAATNVPDTVDVDLVDRTITFPLVLYASRCRTEAVPGGSTDLLTSTSSTILSTYTTKTACENAGKFWMSDSQLTEKIVLEVSTALGSADYPTARFSAAVATTDSPPYSAPVAAAEVMVVDFSIKPGTGKTVQQVYTAFSSATGTASNVIYSKPLLKHLVWTVCNDQTVVGGVSVH